MRERERHVQQQGLINSNKFNSATAVGVMRNPFFFEISKIQHNKNFDS
jgi:hypothetical protein